jgi:hypothetical protein
MASLLEVVITFVGAILVLALAAQSLQEIVKSVLAFKSWARLTAVRRLVNESARAVGLMTPDGEEIMDQVIERLRNLGQKGFFKGRVRLDVVDKKKLADLIAGLDHNRIAGLRALDAEIGKGRLAQVAEQTKKWFDLSVDPVTDRYRRRMQFGALVAGLAVVLVGNADAFWILRQARNDPAFREAVNVQATSLSATDSTVRALNDSLESDTTAEDSVWEPLAARRDSAVAQRDSLALGAVRGDRPLFPGYSKDWRFSLEWLTGILISALLVGLGAPFWHDLLESLVGMKDRIRQRARSAGGGGGGGDEGSQENEGGDSDDEGKPNASVVVVTHP